MVSRKYLRSSSAGCPTGDSSLILNPAYTTNCRCTLWDIWIWHILTYLYERPSAIVRAEEARGTARRWKRPHSRANVKAISCCKLRYYSTLRSADCSCIQLLCWRLDHWSDVWSQLLDYVGSLGFPITEFCFVYISLCQKFCSIATEKGCQVIDLFKWNVSSEKRIHSFYSLPYFIQLYVLCTVYI